MYLVMLFSKLDIVVIGISECCSIKMKNEIIIDLFN